MRSADLRRLRGSADAAWRDAVRREAERIVAMEDPAERARAYAGLARMLAEDGDALPPEDEARILRSLGARGAGEDNAVTWAVERRRLVLMHTLRPVAAVACFAAALAPFVVAALRWRWGLGEALAGFLAPGLPLIGVALAILAAVVMAQRTARANGWEGMAALLLLAFAAGVVGLAVALGTGAGTVRANGLASTNPLNALLFMTCRMG